jgi:hypothetical protein
VRRICRAVAPLQKNFEYDFEELAFLDSWFPICCAVTLKEASMEAEAPNSVCTPLIRSILLYVLDNPDAKDTADGIDEFWLANRDPRYGKHQVRQALDFLVEKKHWLTKNKTGSSVALYGLDKDHIGEIERFLGGPAGKK